LSIPQIEDVNWQPIWKIRGLTLEAFQTGPAWELRPNTSDWDILWRLSDLFYPEISQCALDLIFRFLYSSDCWPDALRAYSTRPLNDPPESYWKLFNQVEWAGSVYAENLYAIILAGRDGPEDVKKLVSILRASSGDRRDGVIYAAAATSNREVIEETVKIAMSSDVDEPYEIRFCFTRWIKRGLLSIQELQDLLRASENEESQIGHKHWMNLLVCKNWKDLPYPSLHRGVEGKLPEFISEC
jgi:hypothetical protein